MLRYGLFLAPHYCYSQGSFHGYVKKVQGGMAGGYQQSSSGYGARTITGVICLSLATRLLLCEQAQQKHSNLFVGNLSPDTTEDRLLHQRV